MKKFIPKFPYKHRITIAIFLFALVPCILLEIICFPVMQQKWEQTVLTDYQNDVDTSALFISKTIFGLQSKMDYILNNSTVRSSLAQANKLSLVQAIDFISVLNTIAGSITADNPSLAVRFYPHLSPMSYGSYCYTLDLFASEFPMGIKDSCYQDIINLKEGQLLWQVRNISREFNNTGTPEMRLCLYTQIENLNRSNCILELSIPISQMLESRTSAFVPGSLFAVRLEQDNTFLNILLDSAFTPEETNLLISRYQQTGHLSSYYILSTPIPNTANSEVIFILPNSYVRDLIRPQIIGFIIISIFLLFVIISASYLTSHLLTKRMILAINTINNQLDDILNAPLTLNYVNDNIDQITLRIQKLVQDTQEYVSRLKHYETENLRMELELLQMRFNPHLLYNTLSAIRHQIRNPEARNSIDSLCHYYRIVLNNGHLLISVKNEIDMIKEYLSIEKFAYHLDNVVFEFEIDDQVAHHTIIKHLLQPIVENALNHGIRPLGHDYCGTLRISAVSESSIICIRIIDNGIGMTSEDTAQLLSAPSASDVRHGYGIYNVQQRIQVYYGKEYGLHIDSIIGKGTTVTLRIPAIPSESRDIL